MIILITALALTQQPVSIVELPEPTVKGTVTLGGPLGVRVLSNGNILVNDARRRQLRLFDSTLSRATVVRDSAPGFSTSYGPLGLPMLRFFGDSSIIGDYRGGTIAVIGPTGQVARVMAPSDEAMLMSVTGFGDGSFDDEGRTLFTRKIRSDPALGLARIKIPDSAMIVRMDADGRRVDTLARLKSTGNTILFGPIGNAPPRFFQEPVPLTDDWTLLSDGTIAIVRGRDYHIDWIARDGAMTSSPKLPFDWKRLTDADKQRIIDSIKVTSRTNALNAANRRRAAGPPDDAPNQTSGRRVQATAQPLPDNWVPREYIVPEFKDIFDFHPPIRRRSLMADLDGNLWILPNTSAQSKRGELVYDVVNPKGAFHRVRMPLGRSLAGFGKGGVVFLLNGDARNGFTLERVKLPSTR
jgi:hypothetical protein